MTKCVVDEKTKYYLIPTLKWLKPIEPLILEDSNTAGLLMIAAMVEKEKVIVKITKGKNKKTRIIGMKLNNIYYFSHTYCSFSCLEDYSKITKKYKNSEYFCDDTGNKMITIEIMKKYSGSLNKLKNMLSVTQTTKILIQILYSLMEAFYKYGFIHEDLSLGNVLYKIKTKNEVIEYNLTKTRTQYDNLLIGEIIPLISDYDKSESYNKEIFEKYSEEPMINKIKGYNETITILDSISKITQNISLLIKNERDKNFIKNEINELFSGENYEKYYRHTYKTLRDYVKGMKTYDELIKETFGIYKELINKIIQIFKNDKKFILIYDLVDNF